MPVTKIKQNDRVAPDAAPRPIEQIKTDLERPIPRRLLETKTLQGHEITFCPWYRVQKIFDHYTGGLWEYEIRERTIEQFEETDSETGVTVKKGYLMLTVRIYITAAEGRLYREGTGIERLDVSSYGDPQSNAESQAFRRACARWGLGLHLYDE